VFENRVLRGTFGPQRKKLAEGWRRLHNEDHEVEEDKMDGA
jgi:hypothetical protein